MSSHNSTATANDPRQPSAAKPFVAPMVSPQDLPVDYSGFIAYKLCSWLALIFCAQSLSNMKNMENDLKQISMASIFKFCLGCLNLSSPKFKNSVEVLGSQNLDKLRKQGFSCVNVEELDTCNGLQSWDWLQITWVQLDLAHKVESEILSIKD
ncbi:hypothetical protein DKX38_022534 [Salix brachista]|uniref:Uncharacterized protein n=1 Tax=Salix brachista TaxID=2182728 RepID=A0A5N5K5H3_9ROSI|nr:hypothetical protein DKX38_022534 [Salix brachista]